VYEGGCRRTHGTNAPNNMSQILDHEFKVGELDCDHERRRPDVPAYVYDFRAVWQIAPRESYSHYVNTSVGVHMVIRRTLQNRIPLLITTSTIHRRHKPCIPILIPRPTQPCPEIVLRAIRAVERRFGVIVCVTGCGVGEGFGHGCGGFQVFDGGIEHGC
jgi:hypothetical protein